MDRGLPSQPIESTLQLYWGSIYMKKIEKNVDLFARAYSIRTCSITDTPVTDSVEFISLPGSWRKLHRVGLFSTGFFFLVVYLP